MTYRGRGAKFLLSMLSDLGDLSVEFWFGTSFLLEEETPEHVYAVCHLIMCFQRRFFHFTELCAVGFAPMIEDGWGSPLQMRSLSSATVAIVQNRAIASRSAA